MATGAGVTGTTSQVATQFRGVLQSLMAPTDSMTKLFKKMGYVNGEAMLKGEGLQGTLDAIVNTADGAGAPLTDYISSIEGVTLALALTGAQHETLTKNMTAMQDVAGRADEAFLAQTQGLNKVGFSMEQLQRYAEVLGQKLGDALAPALAIVLDKVQPLANALVELLDKFVALDSNTQGWILAGIGLAAALGPLLLILPGIAKGITMVAGAMAVMTGPVGLLIGAIVLLGIAWAMNWGGIQEKTVAVLGVVGPKITAFLADLQAMAAVQVGGFIDDLAALEGSTMPEWLKVFQAMMTSGGGDVAVNVTPILENTEGSAFSWDNGFLAFKVADVSATIKPVVEGGAGTSFVWEDGYMTFDVKGNLTSIGQEGFFGESTGLNWDATKGFWMTVNGSVVFDQEAGINTIPDVIVNAVWSGSAPAALWTIVNDFFTKPVTVNGAWEDTAAVGLWNTLETTFKEPVMIFGSWDNTSIVGLWNSLVFLFKEPVMIFAEWGAGVLNGLWNSLKSAVTGTPITVDAAINQIQKNTAGLGLGPQKGPGENSIYGYASGGLAKGLSIVGEQGPELAFFGGMGADILSNPNSLKLLKALGINGFAGGTMPPIAGLAPPMGPQMAPASSYTVQDRPAGLFPPIAAKLNEAAEAMSNAGDSLTESATVMGESTEAFRSALQNVPGLFGASEVTADQMRMAEMGIPQDFADNYLRRLTDEVINGVDWEGVDIGDAAQAAGIDPNLPAEAILELFKAAWNDSSLFSNPENLKFIDQGAVKAAIQKQQDQLAGQMNILALFGIKDDSIATQVEGLGAILATNFETQMTPELFNPVGVQAVSSMAGGFADTNAANAAGGNMVGAIQTALTQADMQSKMQNAGESAAAVYWDGWVNFFKTVTVPVPAPPAGGAAPQSDRHGHRWHCL